MEIVSGRYMLMREIGRGATGVVHAASDLYLERRVAIKLVHVGTSAPRDAVAARLLREAKSLAKVRHPNVVQLYDAGPHGSSYFFFTMELIEGVDMDATLDAGGRRLPASRAAPEVVRSLRGIASGLDAVHAAGLVHRDVKPANVIVENCSKREILVDFGGVTRAGATLEDGVCGTPLYMAPEQLDPSQTITGRADQYSLGCLAYELLSGGPPFRAERWPLILAQHLHAEPVPLFSRRRHGGTSDVDAVLHRVLAKAPDERFPSCSAFVTALAAAFESDRIVDVTSARNAAAVQDATARANVEEPSVDRVLRILIVDGDCAFREVLVRGVTGALFRLPHRIVAAASLREASARCSSAPHLVVVDLDADPAIAPELARLTSHGVGDGGPRPLVVGVTARPPAERAAFARVGLAEVVDRGLHAGAISAVVRAAAACAGWRGAA